MITVNLTDCRQRGLAQHTIGLNDDYAPHGSGYVITPKGAAFLAAAQLE